MTPAQFERVKGFALLWGGTMTTLAGLAGLFGYGAEAMIAGALLVCAGATLAFSRREERGNGVG